MLSYKDEELIDIILKVASGKANENDLYTWIKITKPNTPTF
ncbi:hypothetical protein [uncultured Gardnerella sp.]|nr:hypothetical protein [uncultured Gardnerella sp.]